MEKEEEINKIVGEYELLNEESRELVHTINELWVKREKIRNRYRELSGKDISERPRPK
jgi:uncharacterized coiled-coil DUF342 family protein